VFEIVRYPNRMPTGRELARRLISLSADATERQARLDAITGLVPQVMERTAAISALEQALADTVPAARGRLAFIVDVATAAMTEIATDVGS
jgi:hypothetical protein